jgi:hypothetical protein
MVDAIQEIFRDVSVVMCVTAQEKSSALLKMIQNFGRKLPPETGVSYQKPNSTRSWYF